jgi:hypothetical protein
MIEEVEKNVASLIHIPSSGLCGVGGLWFVLFAECCFGDQMKEDEVQVGKVKHGI